MKNFRFVHASDLHLDSPFTSLTELNPAIAGKLRDATITVFDRIIDLCIEREVDFLLVGGDIYDGAYRSLKAQLRFRKGLQRLSDAGISSYAVHGNHDPLDGWIANLDWPEKTHIFGGDTVQNYSILQGGEKIARVYGISFKTRDVRKNLAKEFRREKDSVFSIGLLHCNVGADTGHEPYAPCALDDLIKSGMDYWALGHVHTRQKLYDRSPMIIYPGNPQGRNPRETGPRGCFLIEVDGRGNPHETFIPVDCVRWLNKEISVQGIDTDEILMRLLESQIDALKEEAESRDIVANFTLVGSGSIHEFLRKSDYVEDLIRHFRENAGTESPFVWLNRIEVKTHSEIDIIKRREDTDFLGELLQIIETYRKLPETLTELQQQLETLYGARQTRKLLDAPSQEQMLALLDDAERLCVEKIAEDSK